MKFSGTTLALVATASAASFGLTEGLLTGGRLSQVNNGRVGVNVHAGRFSKQGHGYSAANGGEPKSGSQLHMAYTVGIVGATGAVGKEIRSCLEDRDKVPVDKLRIFGSSRSAGSEVETKYGKVEVELFDVAAARECDVVFLAVSGDFALEHAQAIAAEGGAVVIDNSSAFRYKPEIPLVVPEINGEETKKSKLIANPNCTTAIGLMALWPLVKKFGLKRCIMSTYQAASGAGQPGMDELLEGTAAYLDGKSPNNDVFAHPLPFNVIPQIDKFQDNLYTKEEMKVTWETRKICGLSDDVPISCSAVRIPTIRAHSEVIVIETEKPVDLDEARESLEDAPGVKLVDNPSELQYPMPLTATGKYDVEVGRLRKSIAFGDHGLEFFVSGDQLLRGAALNAVLVAEEMVANGAL
uniref:aspartate-semialdehyde dehydrogenase n=1 Tax=Craspedostauros australis TaxID=1486917 RepID=A0A7R9WUN3_9STRA|mmetsp:Transcript_21535/g.59926  ORF Transcript_21535/g.59926 Transcript_21535/m.59926 type:complete len:410 (+) Transcript_21535:121-1350(+)|eukprot:CAMPEP_0198120546 /NCGR_PEP_ID=MMETSP1442-20131203/29389_1 /TAXON_ID= /ORGANISM="Craspedostauros australis, Strain CCMP3328" /LENGTH=409 /DNA_ID=CAMNT_0043779207 /DNA_START=60 /DNA_END=1289 /DNA_ORIENTATION=+